ncbi:hypothetical protein F3157_17130 [Virgibacillus dakarensis]|uniref:Uncharacterized protein n=1 Tax=Lentibacillus populi TaxID=1827502 RepID=A0A9W5TZD7_9BACI|nr:MULTISPECIES: VC0807 family protein [Bacillaceae]MBT2217347.1 hypothetical protein [Virgibacillus dakarensis]MTW87363.1 hypothetical protein [Virgibacillus dakarensis]GGB50775.1 hypothetical protein GCM10011409_30400 [Lentibacillus populi]
MKKNIMVLDIVCYAAIPYLLWAHGRDIFGDYLALLLSTVPGFIYTVYRFIKERQFNIAGLSIIGSLVISTTVNLLSATAESMLWNQVYLGFGYAAFFLLSMAIRKPLALYFAVDWAYLQGYRRKDSLALYNTKGIFVWYQLLTLVFVFRCVFQNSLKAWLIQAYGVDAYGQLLIYMNISGFIFSGIIFAGFIFVGVKINKFLEAGRHEQTVKPLEG